MLILNLPQGPDVAVRVELSQFKGSDRLDIRQYFRFEGAESLGPTRKGVNLPVTAIPQLREALERAEREAFDLGALTLEDYEAAGVPVPESLAEAGRIR